MKARTISSLLILSCLSTSCLLSAVPEPKFEAVEIDGDIEIGYGLAVADVDGDGRQDILLADKNEVAWYHNPSWKKHVIAENLTPRDHVCIAAADIDGDGKAEVAVGAEWNPGDTQDSGAVFYLIPSEDRTRKWQPVKLPHEPTTHRMHWVKDWQDGWRLVVLPLHGRGNQGGQGAGVKILSYEVPDDPRGDWSTRVLNESFHMTHNFDPVFWDEDIAHELLVAGREGSFLINWVDGEMAALPVGEDPGAGAGEVRLGTLPGGKRAVASIEPMHGNQLVVYASSGSDDDSLPWPRHVVDDSLHEGHALAMGDLLGTGSDQIVVGWRAMRNPGAVVGIKLFTPIDATGKNWKWDWIDENGMACEDLKLADLNEDGKLDVVAAGRRTQNVKIYWNKTAQ